MKKNTALVIVVSFCLLVACSSSGTDKTEPPKAEPAPAEPAAVVPAPAAVEPAPKPAEPPKPVEPPRAAPKVEGTKAAPAKAAEPKANLPKVTTLSSGLKMIDMKEGQGEAVKTGNTIAVHYTGWLYENGKRGNQFDSSVGRAPFVFTVGSGVIRGWSEGIVGMKSGGKRELIIPSDLAYGEGGAGRGLIPPNATLDFEVELVEIMR